MYIDSSARPREPTPPVGSDTFAEGLMLVRASTLKMIRLQLAMERHDRLVALEAVDELVALDLRLQDYLDSVPGALDRPGFRTAADEDRAALNREKLTLAAEVLRRPAHPAPEAKPLPQAQADEGVTVENEPVQRHRARWSLLAIPLIPALAVVAWLVFANTLALRGVAAGAQGWLAQMMRAVP